MIYLDYNGSTPVDPQVADLVMETTAKFANPSSVQYRIGQDAAEAIEEARHRVAHFVSAEPRDIVLTSGASEAAAIGIIGAALGTPHRPNIVVSITEHKAILAAAETAVRLTGGEVRCALALESGVVDLDHLQILVDESVSLVIAMAANNETGVLNPIEAVAELSHAAGALYFCDATQMAGKGDIGSVNGAADLSVMSSHKIYGPKGAGALVADRHLQKVLVPILPGGGQERGLRGGTQNTPAIAGFGLAAELAAKAWAYDVPRMEAFTQTLVTYVDAELYGVSVNGAAAPRLTNTVNLRFEGADSEAVMASMPDVAVSSGSACQSAVPTQSHVLLAMGLSDTAASESIRISVGRPTTSDEIEHASQALVRAVRRVRSLNA